jgi:hypothetical protein
LRRAEATAGLTEREDDLPALETAHRDVELPVAIDVAAHCVDRARAGRRLDADDDARVRPPHVHDHQLEAYLGDSLPPRGDFVLDDCDEGVRAADHQIDAKRSVEPGQQIERRRAAVAAANLEDAGAAEQRDSLRVEPEHRPRIRDG